MNIVKIELLNFRNYRKKTFDKFSNLNIIIGKNGQMLKKIGSLARKEIEVLLDKKVYLELFVKVIENWRQKPNLFEELGITEEND